MPSQRDRSDVLFDRSCIECVLGRACHHRVTAVLFALLGHASGKVSCDCVCESDRIRVNSCTPLYYHLETAFVALLFSVLIFEDSENILISALILEYSVYDFTSALTFEYCVCIFTSVLKL